MMFLEELLTPLASWLHVPVGVLVFVSLMVMGVFGHYAIYRIVRRLTTAADRTETQWDDVVLYRALCEPRLPHLKEPKHHLPTDLRWLPGIVHGQPFDPQRRGMNGWFNDFGDLIKELTAKTKSKTK